MKTKVKSERINGASHPDIEEYPYQWEGQLVQREGAWHSQARCVGGVKHQKGDGVRLEKIRLLRVW